MSDPSDPEDPEDLKVMVTLWPSLPHFAKFADDRRLEGIRLNSAMISPTELQSELAILDKTRQYSPVHFDIKGRQLRVTEVLLNPKYLDLRLNHPIDVELPDLTIKGNEPIAVLFKAGVDSAALAEVSEGGYRLKFYGGPKYMVKAGESLHIRDGSLKVGGSQFTDTELKKIEMVKAAGICHWFLSYVQCQRDVDEFRELVGKDAIIRLKIEDQKGLNYVAKEYKKIPQLTLVAARGDMYVEVPRPEDIMEATELVVEKDPDAIVGSRLLLSTIEKTVEKDAEGKTKNVFTSKVPECSDWSEMAWLYDIGYRRFMLCDELCLRGNLLRPALNIVDAFKEKYVERRKKIFAGARIIGQD